MFSLLLSYDRLSKKPLLFKSFTGLTLQEFDDIYNKEITKRYAKHELKRLSKRIDRKRKIGAGRHFKLDLKDRFVMLLVYYRLYITYTLAGFLFDLDQKSNICRDIQKIEGLIRQCVPIPQKIYNITKRLQTQEEVEQYFPGLMAFTDSTEQQIPRPIDKDKKENVLFGQKEKTYYVKNHLMVNNHRGYILHKANHHKKGRRHDYDFIRRIILSLPKQVVNVIDLGYLGVEKDFPEQLSWHYRIKGKETNTSCPKKKKSKTKFIPKKRIVIEHTICRLKKYRIMSDIFRNKLRKYNRISDIVSGLINYRIIN